jgi:hypothetical protein
MATSTGNPQKLEREAENLVTINKKSDISV